MNLFEKAILGQVDSIIGMLETMPLDDQVRMLNTIRRRLHEAGPFADEPVDLVEWLPNEQVRGNDYNPNKVPPPEMKLLRHSITEDGYTQPIVSYPKQEDEFEVVDGFHRCRIGKESKAVRTRVHGYLPLTQIRCDRSDIKQRMAATIRHNRARGVHGVIPMADMVATLIKEGWTDTDIAKELGMDADEVLRFKQHLGLPDLFKDHDYSPSWE